MDKSRITAEIEAVMPEIIAVRHQLHQHPELAGEEHNSAKLIRESLSDGKIKLLPPFLDTDVVGLLSGTRGDGKNITLRGDIDALPLTETTGVDYASKIAGRMHACGHDGHTAMLIGAAKVLSKFVDELRGSVRFVFQPGEEVAALGKNLVEAGALLDPEPDMVCALHGWSGMPVGVIGAKSGAMMAAAGFFKIKIIGKGGHGCAPHLAVNPIISAARIIDALPSIPSGMIDAQKPVVISVCHVSSGHNGNVIPDSALIEGTVRFIHPELKNSIFDKINQLASGICAAAGAKCEFSSALPYQPVINHPDAVTFSRQIVKKYLGDNSWLEVDETSMGGEDFCYYLDKYPGVFCRLGIGCNHPFAHNPNFDFNDEALQNGITFLVASAMEFLAEE